MRTNFFVLSGATVPSNYQWDAGNPLETTVTNVRADSTTEYISGYAPALNVTFVNDSSFSDLYQFGDFEWNFGDYYNDNTNTVSLTCIANVEHLYIMPGKYTVTLKQKQTNSESIINYGENLCRGKYDVRWFWNELLDTNPPFNITWNETLCPALNTTLPSRRKPKWWTNETECFQRHCKYWSWYYLRNTLPVPVNPVKWGETESSAIFEKKWMFEPNDQVCSPDDVEFLESIQVTEQVVIKKFIVELFELPPVADIRAESISETGITPLSTQLTPRHTQVGSFPLDRIDWDLGDGSPIITINRYTPLTADNILYTGSYYGDPADVRNYDIIHSYRREINTYPVFYPSITCYSSNTNTSDSCCFAIGPVYLPNNAEVQVVKIRNTPEGNIYTFNNNNNISFSTSVDTGYRLPNIPPNVPPTRLRSGDAVYQTYAGNIGTGFPFENEINCNAVSRSILPVEAVLITDDLDLSDYLTDTTIEDVSGIPILTDRDFLIVP